MRNYFYLLVIGSLLVVIALMAIRSCKQKSQIISDIETIQDIKFDSVKYWRDAAGREHAEKQVAEGSIASLKAVYRTELDSIKAVLKIKDKDIQGLLTVSHQTAGEVTPRIDTVYEPADTTLILSYKDKWLTVKGLIGKKSILQYQVRDSLVFTTYSKRVGLFRKETYLDGYSLNPNARVTGISAIRVSPPVAKRFGIGPYVGYGYYGRQWLPSAGISLHYSLIRF